MFDKIFIVLHDQPDTLIESFDYALLVCRDDRSRCSSRRSIKDKIISFTCWLTNDTCNQ